jgi:hypothetical protein
MKKRGLIEAWDARFMLGWRRAEALARYCRMQNMLGQDWPSALLLALKESPLLLSGRRNVTEGFGFFHLPLLVSYARSGTNMVRYIVEAISGRSTPGQKRLHKTPDVILDRAHCAFPVMDRHPRVILVLRDYRECLLRQHAGAWREKPEVARFLEMDEVAHPPHWYIRNLEAFDRFGGEKLLLYFEDLILDPEPAIRKLAAFLDLDPARTRDFLENLDGHFDASVEAYTSSGHASQTATKKDVQGHARKWLTPGQRREFDLYYQERHPDLYERYLKRYAFSGNA